MIKVLRLLMKRIDVMFLRLREKTNNWMFIIRDLIHCLFVSDDAGRLVLGVEKSYFQRSCHPDRRARSN